MADNYDNNDKLSLHIANKNRTTESFGFRDISFNGGDLSLQTIGSGGTGGVGGYRFWSGVNNGPRTGMVDLRSSPPVTGNTPDWVFQA